MSLVTLNFDLSKIPFVRFEPGPKIKRTFTGSHLRAVTDADDDDADNAGHHSTITMGDISPIRRIITNFDGVVLYEHHALELLSLGHVERCASALLGAPSSTDERVAHDDAVLMVAWVDVQRRVARAVLRTRAQIHRKPARDTVPV